MVQQGSVGESAVGQEVPSPVVRAVAIGKSFGRTRALDSVDFTIDAGQITALVGPNGAGKTTFVSILAGLLDFDDGELWVAGTHKPARQRWALRGLVGFVPQDFGIYPGFTVRENLRYFGRLAGLEERELAAQEREVVEGLDLVAIADRRAVVLSGGEKRRAHTGIGLVNERSLLLLDEPTAGADIEMQRRLLEFVRDLAQRGAAVVYTTHQLREVETLGAAVTVLNKGTVVATGSSESLTRSLGEDVIEMEFECEPRIDPTSLAADHWQFDVNGPTVRLRGAGIRDAVPAVLSRLGEQTRYLRKLDVHEASLETVITNLTRSASVPTSLEQREIDRSETSPLPSSQTEVQSLRRPLPTGPDWKAGLGSTRRVVAGFRDLNFRIATVMAHEWQSYRRDPLPIMLAVGVPVVLTVFTRESFGVVLRNQGFVGATGAEQAIPGMATTFNLFLMSFIGVSIYHEYAWGTWDRLRASGLPVAAILYGKLLVPVLIGVAQIVLITGMGVIALKLELRGSAGSLLALGAASAIATVGIAFALVTVTSTLQQLTAVASAVAILIAGVGGAIVPHDALPGWIQAVAPATPAYWAMDGYRGALLEGRGVADVMASVGVLLVFGIAATVFAALRFSGEMKKL